MKYRCQIEHDLWTARRNHMIRKTENEYRARMKHPYLFVYRESLREVPEMLGSAYRSFKRALGQFFRYRSLYHLKEAGLSILSGLVLFPFTLYIFIRARHFIEEQYKSDMTDFDVEYPWEFEGVWGDPDLKTETVLDFEEEESYSYLDI